MKSFVRSLRRSARGANFVEYMVLVALAIGAVVAGAKTLGDAMSEGTKTQSKNIGAGFVQGDK